MKPLPGYGLRRAARKPADPTDTASAATAAATKRDLEDIIDFLIHSAMKPFRARIV